MPRYLVQCTVTVNSSYVIDAPNRDQAEEECLEIANTELDCGDHEVLDAEVWSVHELPTRRKMPKHYLADPDCIIREDGRIERLCKHGVGHPIGVHYGEWKQWMSIHGCDGCCKDYERLWEKEKWNG